MVRAFRCRTVVRTKTLIFESGSLSPVPLESNGRLEAALLGAIEARVNGSADATAGIGSSYRGKPEFWERSFRSCKFFFEE